jgi:hypothetical protein
MVRDAKPILRPVRAAAQKAFNKLGENLLAAVRKFSVGPMIAAANEKQQAGSHSTK